jgi:hypothetical protein
VHRKTSTLHISISRQEPCLSGCSCKGVGVDRLSWMAVPMPSSPLRGARCTVAALLFAAFHLCAAAQGDKCQALGFTGPVCSDCDMMASYVKDDGVLPRMVLQRSCSELACPS